MDFRPILHTLHTEGSGPQGVSSRSKYISECHRAIYLDKTHPRPEPDYYAVGRIGHIYNELHHTRGGFNLRDLQLSVDEGMPLPSQAHLLVAEAAFRNYRAHVTPDGLGDVLEAEKTYEAEVDGHRLSTKPDLMTRVNSRHAHKIAKTLSVHVTPGIWIWDYKFVSSHPNIDAYVHNVQFMVMRAVLEVARPDLPIEGIGIIFIPKDGTSRPKVAIAAPFTALERRIVNTFCETTDRARAMYEAALVDKREPDCNHTKCFYPSRCGHYDSGACARF
jgi:hypothetical protein